MFVKPYQISVKLKHKILEKELRKFIMLNLPNMVSARVLLYALAYIRSDPSAIVIRSPSENKLYALSVAYIQYIQVNYGAVYEDPIGGPFSDKMGDNCVNETLIWVLLL